MKRTFPFKNTNNKQYLPDYTSLSAGEIQPLNNNFAEVKNLIRLTFTIGVIVLYSLFTQSLAFAQDNEVKKSTPEDRATFLTQWMQSELSLDSTVVSAVYDINLKYAKKNQAIMDSDDLKFQKYKGIKASSDAKDLELKNIFTTGQYDLYQEKKSELREKMKERYKQRKS